jgi:selenocysteine lyase/cysteine desulfurase
MITRRHFLGSIRYPVGFAGLAAAAAPAMSESRLRGLLAEIAAEPLNEANPAGNEDFWASVQQMWTMDRGCINLNNGGVSPSPRIVQEAVARHLARANDWPPPVVLWREQEPAREAVRERLARQWGCDPEELALTRNSSESLQICQFGIDLKPGDEVITSTQDYPRMLSTFKQRERREGVVLKQIKIPVPCEDPASVVKLFADAVTPRTRMILMSHVINLTGQILPVKAVVDMARTRNGGIPVVVDGAHGLAHFDFRIPDLGCDYYGVSLHKWLFAPHGCGLLYVRRPLIKTLWSLMGSQPEHEDDIRKFEEIGTHPVAQTLAIGEALTLHQAIGPARKEARLRHLRNHWANRLVEAGKGRVTLNTSLKPEFSCGIGNVRIDGVDTEAVANFLWEKHRILVVAIKHAEFEGLRITPNLYTTFEELDRFCDIVEGVIKNGIPKDVKQP